MPIRAVILDFDGVIYDSSSLKVAGKKIVQLVKLRGYKIPRNIHKKLNKNWGLSAGKLLEASFGINPEIAEKIYREWEKMDKIEFYPLIQKPKMVIKKLEARQIKVLLLTNRSRKSLIKILYHFELVGFFDFLQTKDDWFFTKPNPHAFCFILHWLAKSGIHPHECIYVGDTILDFKCTIKRGLVSVSVTTGVFSKSDFLKAGQKKENIIGSIADLPEWINRHGRA